MGSRVLVCGAGSIGRRHIANLKALGATPLLWRSRSELASQAALELEVDVDTDRTRLLARSDAVVVATAPDSHVALALEALEAGLPVFLEKPVAHDRTGVDALLALARETGLAVEIGCQLRHHPTLRELARRIDTGEDGPVLAFQACIGQRLDQWRPGTDHRTGFSADAARGGGALFELVHEIDAIRWIAGPIARVGATLRTLGDPCLKADDLANLTLELRGGAVGQIQLDMLSPAYRRHTEIICRDALWRWDYLTGELTRTDAQGVSSLVAKPPAGFERNDMFLAHMRHFLSRVTDPQLSASCSLPDGVAVLDVALAARRSNGSDGRMITLEAEDE